VPGRSPRWQRYAVQLSHVVEVGNAARADVDRVEARAQLDLDQVRQLGQAVDGAHDLGRGRYALGPLPADYHLDTPAVPAAERPGAVRLRCAISYHGGRASPRAPRPGFAAVPGSAAAPARGAARVAARASPPHRRGSACPAACPEAPGRLAPGPVVPCAAAP